MVQANAVPRERYGVTGVSALHALTNGFDYIRRCPPDPLHQLDLGLVRSMLHLWFDTENHREAYYVAPAAVRVINDQLLTVKVPHTFKGKCRLLSDLKRFKGHDLRLWVICYAPVLLMHVLPEPVWQHLLLLSVAAYVLSQKSVSIVHLLRLKYSLRVFQCYFQQIYGEHNMSYNFI